jgi:hypothetical protein
MQNRASMKPPFPESKPKRLWTIFGQRNGVHWRFSSAVDARSFQIDVFRGNRGSVLRLIARSSNAAGVPFLFAVVGITAGCAFILQ